MSTRVQSQVSCRFQRLFQLLCMLQVESWSNIRLANHFEVSRRTIFRDIQVLRDAGADIQCVSKDDGYRAVGGQAIDLQFSPLELLAIACTSRDNPAADIPLLKAARLVAIGKLIAGASPKIRQRVSFALQKLDSLQSEHSLDDQDQSTITELIESWLQ